MANGKNTGKAQPKKTTWTKKRGEDLLLPSGNTARVRRPGPEALLKKGVLPDALAAQVQEMIAKGKGTISQKQTEELGNDPETVLAMLDAMDRVLCTVVLEPKVLYHRNDKGEDIPEEEREDGIYTDDVDFEDKSFIFQYAVGGTRDLARFRRETGISLGDVSDEQGDGDAS